MKKDYSTLAIINLHLEKEFTKNSNELLRELLLLFIKEAPEFQKEINHAFQQKEKQKLNDLLHTLIASCIYCGLDRLKASVTLLKASVSKDNYPRKQLDDFNQEIENVKIEANKI